MIVLFFTKLCYINLSIHLIYVCTTSEQFHMKSIMKNVCFEISHIKMQYIVKTFLTINSKKCYKNFQIEFVCLLYFF